MLPFGLKLVARHPRTRADESRRVPRRDGDERAAQPGPRGRDDTVRLLAGRVHQTAAGAPHISAACPVLSVEATGLGWQSIRSESL